jgi:hypothetical protein
MQNGTPRLTLATHPVLSHLVQLRSGGSYGVDSAGLAMALMAGPSRAGAWSAVVGIDDFGVEAAEAMGVDLTRTVLVPDPGEHWAEVTGALIDVVTVVALRPPSEVSERIASRLNARLRQRSAILIAWGNWPRCEARLTLHEPVWSGLGQGHGYLQARQAILSVRRGAAPPVQASIWLPPPNDGPIAVTADESVDVQTDIPADIREVG